MVIYRIGIDALYERLEIWNGYLLRKVRLIACGGTALTLLGFKDSTKDVDLMVPDEREYGSRELDTYDRASRISPYRGQPCTGKRVQPDLFGSA